MKPMKKRSYKQGYYELVYPEKYLQPLDKTMNKQILPQYRSSWELKFFKFCDSNPLVIKWGVEPFPIQYWSPVDNRMRRYFVDGYIEFKSGDRFLVEIKPKAQTVPPKEPKRKTPKSISKFNSDIETFLTNQAKWEAAKRFADERGLKFIILTERELGV